SRGTGVASPSAATLGRRRPSSVTKSDWPLVGMVRRSRVAARPSSGFSVRLHSCSACSSHPSSPGDSSRKRVMTSPVSANMLFLVFRRPGLGRRSNPGWRTDITCSSSKDDDTREVLETALGVLGVTATAVDNARDGLAALRAGLDCCVVLLDWRMPEMGGQAFLRAGMKDGPLVGTAVVVVTGDGLRPERAATLGIRGIVHKPADPGAVLAAVERHCPQRDS